MADHTSAKTLTQPTSETWVSMAWGRLLRQVVGRFETGTLSIDLPSGNCLVLRGERPGRNAHVAIHLWRAVARTAFSGDIGFADSIASGDCSSNDLKTLLLWGLDNSGGKDSIGEGSFASRVLSRIRHGRHANTHHNSRRNIAAHYDLGNAFYAAWLDDGLNYSSGIYEMANATLDEAQATKIERVAELMDLRGGERILEIGCGWGALAQYLITRHQCHVTGLTLSTEQLSHTRQRLSAFEEHADIRLQDYRDVAGKFDRIVSVEMIEAVGEVFWPAYFNMISSHLSGEGTAVLQAITIDESRYDYYRRRPDFIQLSIFPGGMLPTKSIIAAQAERAGLCVCRADHFGGSYARTLADWRIRFNQAWPSIEKLGFDERFRRLWDYYLVYCEVGFEAGWLSVGHYQLRHQR